MDTIDHQRLANFKERVKEISITHGEERQLTDDEIFDFNLVVDAAEAQVTDLLYKIEVAKERYEKKQLERKG